MQEYAIETIAVTNLLISTENPRFDPVASQREAISTIAHDQGMKLVNLADDIVARGMNPSDLPIVMPAGDGTMFVVQEGNRRLAALKILSSPGLAETLHLPARLLKKWKGLEEESVGSVPAQITCVVMSPEDAKEWIGLKHTGENEGVGVVTWDGRARHRFRGSSPALQAIDLVEQRGYLDTSTKDLLPKIHITNIERVLGTPDARKLLGVDVQAGELILVGPEDEALGRLSILVGDVAHRRKKVSDLDSKPQRVEYAEQVAAMDLPRPPGEGGTRGQAGDTTTTAGTSRAAGKHGADRRTLIPRRLKLSIPQTRLNQIYDELQKLDISKFTNSGAVLFRVFVELSIDDFASRNSILLKAVPKPNPGKKPSDPARVPDMNLRNKIITVAKYLENQGISDKHELHGVRSLANNTDHVLSVDSLNAYVHNPHYNPNPTDLKANWDSIQTFVERLWA